MKTTRIIITLLLAMTAGIAHAQWTLEGYGECDYSRTGGTSGAFALKGDYGFADNFKMGLGLQATTSGRYSLNFLYQVDLLKAQRGTLYLENRYLYRLYPDYNTQEFNALLDLGWRNRHWNFQMGLCNRYYADIPLRINGGMGTVFEPMNVTFCIEGHVFDQQHPWNIGGRVSNYRDFVIERFTLFFYSLDGYYDLGNGLRLTAEAGVHPCGVLNLSAQYNGWFAHAGLIWKPKH